MLKELELKLSEYLGVRYFHFVANGTVALKLALDSLGITEGQVITTPFSYVATASSILWQRLRPIFVDIEPDNYTLDYRKIEGVVTESTRAILGVLWWTPEFGPRVKL